MLASVVSKAVHRNCSAGGGAVADGNKKGNGSPGAGEKSMRPRPLNH